MPLEQRMAVFNSVFFYLLLTTVSNLAICAHGISTMTPTVNTGSIPDATTTTTMTAKVTTAQSTPVATATGSTAATGTTIPKTTGPPATVVPPSTTVGNWTLKDDNGKICMQMSFAAQMNVSYTKNDGSPGMVVVNVMPSRTDVTATCKSGKPGRELTVYPFTHFDSNWHFELSFKKSSGGFALIEVGTSWFYDSRFVDSSRLPGVQFESFGTDNFLDQSVTLGKSYSCVKPLTVVTGVASVQLWDMNLQPFAEEAGGNFGEAETCNAGMGVNLIVIIAAVVGALLLIAVVSLVVIIVVKKRKRTGGAPYSNF